MVINIIKKIIKKYVRKKQNKMPLCALLGRTEPIPDANTV